MNANQYGCTPAIRWTPNIKLANKSIYVMWVKPDDIVLLHSTNEITMRCCTCEHFDARKLSLHLLLGQWSPLFSIQLKYPRRVATCKKFVARHSSKWLFITGSSVNTASIVALQGLGYCQTDHGVCWYCSLWLPWFSLAKLLQ